MIMLILAARILRTYPLSLADSKGRKGFVFVNLLLIPAFLTNTGNLLFFVSTLMIYAWANRDKVRFMIRFTTPFAGFYVLYYLVFLVLVPFIAFKVSGETTPFGQLHQNLARRNSSYPNITSLLKNLQAVNGYFLPWISWGLLVCALIRLIKHERVILAWVSLYALAWSFYFTSMTYQYFILLFILLLPFAIQFLYRSLGRPATITACLIIALLAGGWNYVVFIQPYGKADPAFPEYLLRIGYAHVGRNFNRTEPFYRLARDLDTVLDRDGRFVHDISGCFANFYYNDRKPARFHSKYAGPLRKNNLVRTKPGEQEEYHLAGDFSGEIQAVVTRKNIADARIKRRITYPRSEIKLYILHDRRGI
jgi:hypothetical protein